LLNYYTQPWYYITLAAFAAAAIDVFFGVWPISSPAPMPMLIRSARPLVAWTLLSLTISANWKELATRHTNVDLVANRLQSLTKTGDVILVPQPGLADFAAKAARLRPGAADNPFIEPNACRAYAAAARKKLEQRIADERK